MNEPTLRVLSLGGGTQSCALALMSASGELPRLDAVIFADTHGELPETYGYIWFLAGKLADAGIPLFVESAGNLEAAILGEKMAANPTPPAHVQNPDGSKGRLAQHRCSYDFKRLVVTRKIKSLCGKRGAWKRANVEQWIGFSADEGLRMKDAEACRCGHNRTVRKDGETVRIHSADGCSRCACAQFDPWITNRWPLAELGMKRHDTIAWFARNGHPIPERSACWFCPNSEPERWQYLKANHPDLWTRACSLDEAIRDNSTLKRGHVKFEGLLYLHGSLAPLATADIRTRTQMLEDDGVFQLWAEDQMAGSCSTGECGT